MDSPAIKEQCRSDKFVASILNTLIVLKNHLALYGRDNNNVALTATRLQSFLNSHFAQHDSLHVLVARHGFVINDAFIERKNSHFEKFSYQLFQHGIAAIHLSSEVSMHSVMTFLEIVNRKPSETWDEGGIEACLQLRNITGIGVRELSDIDFTLDGTGIANDEILAIGGSSLWDRFSIALLQSLGCDKEQCSTPEQLAKIAGESLKACSVDRQAEFARDTSRFLLALKHENIVSYRKAALLCLADFVEHLDLQVREMFLASTFSTNISPELAEEFFSALSDKVILEALQKVADGENYIPPMIVKMLGKLASYRGLKHSPLPARPEQDTISSRHVKDLFKPDDFKKYVPENYQAALLSILKSDTLLQETKTALSNLKQTLEEDLVANHLGAVLLEILKDDTLPEEHSWLSNQLVDTIDHYLQTKDFKSILVLCRQCLPSKSTAGKFPEMAAYLASSRFTAGALDAARTLGRAQQEDLIALIAGVRGPFVLPLLDRLAGEKDRNQRQFCLAALRRIGTTAVAPITQRLNDPRWFVCRNMLNLLRDLGAIEVLPSIRHCLQHSHPKVAEEALMTCLAFGDQAAEHILLQRIENEDGPDLLKSVLLARLTTSEAVADRLFQLLESTGLINYRLEIRRAAVRSLAISKPKGALTTFSRVLASSSLLHARDLVELKKEIIKALANFDKDDVLPILDQQTRSQHPEIARAASLLRTHVAERREP